MSKSTLTTRRSPRRVILWLIAASFNLVHGNSHEQRLIRDLMKNYNNLERPVGNESEALKLELKIMLQQIISVDEKNQQLITNVWLNLRWNDVNMRWNKSEYGGVTDIRIPPDKLWKPDVLMYNSADEAFDGTYEVNVIVHETGLCEYNPPGIFLSTCKIDITWFPFDDQDCLMKFGSWTHDGNKIDLKMWDVDGDEGNGDIYPTAEKNGEWALLGIPGKRNNITYEASGPEPYIDITFTIKIRRRTLYYFFNLIVPCILIASMAVLGFTLPPDSGEKLSLGVTILLSLTVFSQVVAEEMPATSDAVPLLGSYFNAMNFMVAASVVTTIMILNYHHRLADTHDMPAWVRTVFLHWIPWALRMGRPGEKITRKSIAMREKLRQVESSRSLLANVLDMEDDFRRTFLPTQSRNTPRHPSHALSPHNILPSGLMVPPLDPSPPPVMKPPPLYSTVGDPTTDAPNSIEFSPGVYRNLSLILKEIRVITDKIRDDEETTAVEEDWKFAAMVLDRLCLITFTLFTIIATIALLLAAPHIIVN